MTRYSGSRGIMYTAPPTDDDEDDEAVEAGTTAENGEATPADD